MPLFSREKDKHDGFTLIIGCGRLGGSLATALSDSGLGVAVIDMNKDATRKLPASYGGITVIGDATDPSLLAEAGIEEADAVVAVTNNDNVNIMAALMAKEMFHKETVVARLYDPDRECVYREFGINTVCPTVLSSKAIAGMLGLDLSGGEKS